MIDLRFDFEAEIWLWSAKDAWHFVTLPQDQAEEISSLPRSQWFWLNQSHIAGRQPMENINLPRQHQAVLFCPSKKTLEAEDIGKGMQSASV